MNEHDTPPLAAQAPSETEKRIALFSYAAVTSLIVFFLLHDARAFVNSPQDELIGHLGASGGFTVAATGTLFVLLCKRPALLTILLVGAAITVAGELAQGLVPNRGIELRDIAAGFGGVLVTAVGIELVFLLFTGLVALRLHTAAASIASVILLVMLVFELAPDTLAGAAPDGDDCPLTLVDGSGQRITIGAEPPIVDACLRTEVGGLGAFGPEGATSLTDDTVLLSSPLEALTDRIIDTGGLTVRTQFVTGDFSDDVRPPGAIMVLHISEIGELVHIRTTGQTTQVFAPSFPDPNRSASYSQVLEPNTRYELRVELTSNALAVFVDGELVGTSGVEPSWLDVLAESDEPELTLYIANAPGRTLPFQGVIEWVEIDT